MVHLGKLEFCRVCESPNIKTFFNLGKQPLANSLLKSSEEKEEFYPLALGRCSDCGLVQLNYTVDPKVLFSNYVWVTGSSKSVYAYAETFCEEFIKRGELKKEGYVLEIASNDGTFLKPFVKNGYEVLGVDPAKNVAELAEKNGVPTKCFFWNIDSAEELLKEKGPAQAIFARNVLPHVANTRDFVKGIAKCLKPDGVAVIEAHYAKIILEELHYDSIYHEHLCYFTFKSLEKLLNDFGLHIFDIMGSPISGGSMVVYASKDKRQEMPVVKEYRDYESKEKINAETSWQNFAKRSFEHREKLLALLETEKLKNARLIGWGASARSSTLLNFCGIGPETIPVIADSTPFKQGLYTAGTHIKIEKWETAMAKNPDAVFIMAWNFAKEIKEILKNQFNFKGDCVIPFPKEPHIEKMS